MMRPDRPASRVSVLLLALSVVAVGSLAGAHGAGLSFEQPAAVRSVGDVELSPDGSRVAFTLSVPRKPGEDDDGSAWSELHMISADGSAHRPFIAGHVNVSSIRFSPGARPRPCVASYVSANFSQRILMNE